MRRHGAAGACATAAGADPATPSATQMSHTQREESDTRSPRLLCQRNPVHFCALLRQRGTVTPDPPPRTTPCGTKAKWPLALQREKGLTQHSGLADAAAPHVGRLNVSIRGTAAVALENHSIRDYSEHTTPLQQHLQLSLAFIPKRSQWCGRAASGRAAARMAVERRPVFSHSGAAGDRLESTNPGQSRNHELHPPCIHSRTCRHGLFRLRLCLRLCPRQRALSRPLCLGIPRPQSSRPVPPLSLRLQQRLDRSCIHSRERCRSVTGRRESGGLFRCGGDDAVAVWRKQSQQPAAAAGGHSAAMQRQRITASAACSNGSGGGPQRAWCNDPSSSARSPHCCLFLSPHSPSLPLALSQKLARKREIQAVVENDPVFRKWSAPAPICCSARTHLEEECSAATCTAHAHRERCEGQLQSMALMAFCGRCL